ncbi:MAG: VanZ family protein [Thermoplasmatota archaeon]
MVQPEARGSGRGSAPFSPRRIALASVLWLVVALYAAGIFSLSSKPLEEQSSEVQGIHETVNQTVTAVAGDDAAPHTPDVEHFFLYLGFGLPVCAAVLATRLGLAGSPRPNRGTRFRSAPRPGGASSPAARGGSRELWIAFCLAALFILLYALSDEIHQSFVPGREASALDLLIDTLGGSLGAFALAMTAGALRRARKASCGPGRPSP